MGGRHTMNIRRAKPRTWPRLLLTRHDKGSEPGQNKGRDEQWGQQRDVVGDAALARWLAAAEEARSDPTGRRYWSLYTSPIFAEVWYAARDAGERLRAEALVTLYQKRARPGGTHPDPRLPAAFSERAILSTVARRLGLQISQRPTPKTLESAEHAEQTEPKESGGPIVWLMTYPREDGVAPTIWLHEETKRITDDRILFELACMIGFITREEGRMLDPDAPHGVTLLPQAPGALVLMHQFAKALLCRSGGCPSELECSCDLLWQRYNAPPPDHVQSTDALDREEVMRKTPDLRRSQES